MVKKPKQTPKPDRHKDPCGWTGNTCLLFIVCSYRGNGVPYLLLLHTHTNPKKLMFAKSTSTHRGRKTVSAASNISTKHLSPYDSCFLAQWLTLWESPFQVLLRSDSISHSTALIKTDQMSQPGNPTDDPAGEQQCCSQVGVNRNAQVQPITEKASSEEWK